MKRQTSPVQVRGIAMLEVAIAVLALSLIIASLLPIVTAQYKRSTALKNANATEVAKSALVGYAMMNGGLPPPYQFTGDSDVNRATIASPVVFTDFKSAGALPYDLLGTPVSGTLAVPLLYDAHPALRRDLTYTFNVNHYVGQYLDTAGTGGNMQQLCRNLNTLAAIETSVRAATAPFANPTTAYAAVLPRVWRDGLTANFTTPASNSTGVAAVVVRRNPYALRQYDRENNVAMLNNGYTKTTAPSTLRIYENPATGENEVRNTSMAAYAGNTSAISYNELRDALVKAGQCGSGAAMCTNNQLYVTIQNNVQVTKTTGVTQGAMLQWRQPPTLAYTSLAYGQVVSQCMDAMGLDPAGSNKTLALRVSLDEGTFGEVSQNMVGTGGWLTGTTVLTVPSTQAMVVRCGGTYALSGASPTFTLTPSTLTGCVASN